MSLPEKPLLLIQSILSIIKPSNVTQEDYAALVKIVSKQPLDGGDHIIQILAQIALELESNEQRALNYEAYQQNGSTERQAPVQANNNPSKRTPEQTAKLQDWLITHMDHPYPSESEKNQLAIECQMTVKQINYWFTNARRRLLPVLKKMETSRSSPVPETESSSSSDYSDVSQSSPSALPLLGIAPVFDHMNTNIS